MQRYNFSIIPPKKCGRKKMRKKDAEENNVSYRSLI